MRLPEAIRSCPGLCKAQISLFAALSAGTGFLLAGHPSWAMLPALILGVFLMACGASALNHCQEWRSDSRMPRTSGRPIPAGKIRPSSALWFSLLLVASGAVTLASTGSWHAPLLGIGAVFWYNGFYTWMKGHHAFAAFPGALVGAIPPAIGWTAGGRWIFDSQLAAICFFFFMWQVPHFLLHQQAFGREYEAVRLPSLTTVFTGSQLHRLTFQWLLATAASLQLILLQGLIESPLVQIFLLAASLGFAVEGIPLIRAPGPDNPRLFRSTNCFMALVMILFAADRFPTFL